MLLSGRGGGPSDPSGPTWALQRPPRPSTGRDLPQERSVAYDIRCPPGPRPQALRMCSRGHEKGTWY
eukprot:4623229-Pyramimonas_sp.AAC.1